MTAYYNEIDPYCVEWLRNLIKKGLIADGDVDERSITDVEPADLRGYTQCHFFAGIGGWSLALRMAGWDDSRHVWTGSCPCQPFSAAGKQKGVDDSRHLWPVWFQLIAQCQPPTTFGEQVRAAIKHGWLDTVYDDLEGENYTVGAVVLPACRVGAPHIRQRLWFAAERLADTDSGIRGRDSGRIYSEERSSARSRDLDGRDPIGFANGSEASRLADTSPGGQRIDGGASPWHDIEWLECTDGKARPTQPGLSPLATGVSGRVGRLRAYGNAIAPPLAAEFIAAWCERD